MARTLPMSFPVRRSRSIVPSCRTHLGCSSWDKASKFSLQVHPEWQSAANCQELISELISVHWLELACTLPMRCLHRHTWSVQKGAREHLQFTMDAPAISHMKPEWAMPLDSWKIFSPDSLKIADDLKSDVTNNNQEDSIPSCLTSLPALKKMSMCSPCRIPVLLIWHTGVWLCKLKHILSRKLLLGKGVVTVKIIKLASLRKRTWE